MSYCEIIPFLGGKPKAGIDFGNSWGGSARIWTSLFDAYVEKRHQYDSWLVNNGDDARLWDLVKRKDLPKFERAVHAFTFDRFFVRKEHFKVFAEDLRRFDAKYPVAGKVNHLPAMAEWFDSAECEGAGWMGTSVSGSQWTRQKTCPHCGQSTDESEEIDLSEGTEVYDWLID